MKVKTRKAFFYMTPNGKEPAKDWLDSLKDEVGKVKILTSIRRAETGNFGKHRRLSEGVQELRIFYGPGYRVYYGIDEEQNLIILLIGGTKSSQGRDILKANSYWNNYTLGTKYE